MQLSSKNLLASETSSKGMVVGFGAFQSLNDM